MESLRLRLNHLENKYNSLLEQHENLDEEYEDLVEDSEHLKKHNRELSRGIDRQNKYINNLHDQLSEETVEKKNL